MAEQRHMIDWNGHDNLEWICLNNKSINFKLQNIKFFKISFVCVCEINYA